MALRFFVWVLVFAALSPPAMAAARQAATEHDAIQRSVEAMEQYELTSEPEDCMAFYVDPDGQNKKYFTVVVKEKHDSWCGGDSAVEPALITTRVQKQNGAVRFYDAAEDQYVSAEAYKKAFPPDARGK